MREFDAGDIRQFYDRHTPAFVALGQRGSHGAIHRAVWGPGATGHEQAFRYVENEIATLLRNLPPAFGSSTVVDLGCGVGASLCYLAQRLPLRGTGLTLSPVQARAAGERIRASGFADRIRCIEADFCDPAPGVEPADLAYAIESFAHVTDPARFFAACRGLVRPGGLLVICDDVRRHTSEPAASHSIERFRRGWRINTLLDRDELRSLARGRTAGGRAPAGTAARARSTRRRAALAVSMAARRGHSIRIRVGRQRAADMPRARMDRVRPRPVPACRLARCPGPPSGTGSR